MSVSIVIPIRNRPALIDACLGSLVALDPVPSKVEVIVVDDASTDETASTAERWTGRLPLRVIRNAHRAGPGGARNIGAAAARGDVLAFIDGDCRADPAWLSNLLQAFEREDVVAVGGGLVSAEERTWIQRYESVSHPSQRGSTAGDVHPGTSNDFLPGCNILVRRDAFDSIGGFDTTHNLGEDVDLIWRLATGVGRVVYRPEGLVAHEHVDRLWTLLRRRYDLGTSHGVLLRRHPASRRTFVVSLPQLVGAGATLGSIWNRWAWAIALIALAADLGLAIRRGRGQVSVARAAVALAKGYVSVLLRALTLIDQYFLLPLVTAGAILGTFRRPFLFVPAILLAVAGGLSLVDRLRVGKGLGVARFVVVRTLDRIALHVGILAGCVIHRTIRPLAVRFRIAPATADLLRFGHSGAWVENDPLFKLAAGSRAEVAVDDRDT